MRVPGVSMPEPDDAGRAERLRDRDLLAVLEGLPPAQERDQIMTAPATITIGSKDDDVLRQAADHLRSRETRNDPPPGSMTVRSGDVERVCRGLRDRFPETFGHLDEWSIVHAEEANPPKKGCKARARVVIVPPVYQQLYGDDLLVLVSEKWWDTADDRERQAGLYHALCHVWTATDPETGETIGLRTSSHQVEAFHDELAHFGAWSPEVRETVNQLAMFDDSVAR